MLATRCEKTDSNTFVKVVVMALVILCVVCTPTHVYAKKKIPGLSKLDDLVEAGLSLVGGGTADSGSSATENNTPVTQQGRLSVNITGALNSTAITDVVGNITATDSTVSVGGNSLSSTTADSVTLESQTYMNGDIDARNGSTVIIGGSHLSGIQAGSIDVKDYTRVGGIDADNANVRVGGTHVH